MNLLAEIIPGLLLPGNPLVNMVFKVYSVQTLTEAVSFVQDLKLGHYIKVPPRVTFLGAFFLTPRGLRLTCFTCSTIDCDGPCDFCSVRSKGMDICQC